MKISAGATPKRDAKFVRRRRTKNLQPALDTLQHIRFIRLVAKERTRAFDPLRRHPARRTVQVDGLHAMIAREPFIKDRPVRSLLGIDKPQRQQHQRKQQIMQLILVAKVRP